MDGAERVYAARWVALGVPSQSWGPCGATDASVEHEHAVLHAASVGCETCPVNTEVWGTMAKTGKNGVVRCEGKNGSPYADVHVGVGARPCGHSWAMVTTKSDGPSCVLRRQVCLTVEWGTQFSLDMRLF
jgi:hypothetical protein